MCIYYFYILLFNFCFIFSLFTLSVISYLRPLAPSSTLRHRQMRNKIRNQSLGEIFPIKEGATLSIPTSEENLERLRQRMVKISSIEASNEWICHKKLLTSQFRKCCASDYSLARWSVTAVHRSFARWRSRNLLQMRLCGAMLEWGEGGRGRGCGG